MAGLHSLLHACEHLTRSGFADTTDADLLERFCSGDEEAFAVLVRRHGPLVLGVCRRELGREHDAEDVFQATFLVLARKASHRCWQNSVAGWLFETAYRLTREAKRRDHRRARREQLARSVPNVPTPDVEASRRELEAVLDEELARLPERYRTTLLLCLFDGRSRDEAAREIGCSLRTVKYRLERGRELLRKQLRKRGWALSTALTLGTLNASRAHAVAEPLVEISTSLAMGHSLEKSASVVSLADKVTTTSSVGVRVFVAVLFVVGATALAGGLLHPTPSGGPMVEAGPVPPSPQAEKEQDAEPPLPERTLLRFGTRRFRHPNGMQRLVLSPDQRTLVTFGGDNLRATVQMTDAKTGRVLRVLRVKGKGASLDWGVRLIDVSPDSKTLAVASSDGLAHLYDMKTGKELEQYRTGATKCDGVAFSLDGSRLLTSQKGTRSAVKMWDRKTKKQLWEARPFGRFLLFSPDGGTVFVADGSTAEHTALVQLDAKTGTELRRFSHGERITGATLSPDGRRLITAGEDQRLVLWDTAKATKIRSLNIPLTDKSMYPIGLAFSPDGKHFTVGASDNHIYLWDVEKAEPNKVLKGHGWWVVSTTFSADGNTLYSGSWDKTIRRWDVGTGKELPSPEGFASSVSVAMTADRQRIAVAGRMGQPIVWLCDAKGTRLGQLAPLDTIVNSLTFSHDGKHLATGHSDGSVRLWTSHGKFVKVLAKAHQEGKKFRVTELEFTKDDKYLAAAIDHADIVRLLSMSGEKERQLAHPSVVCLAWSPDGRRMLTGGWDHHLRVWDVARGKPIVDRDLKAIVDDIAYSPDGRTFATSHHHVPIQIWDAKSLTVLHKLQGHQEAVFRIAYTPNGQWLLSGGVDRTLRLWDVASGKQVDQFDGHEGWIVDIQSDGLSVLTGSLDSTALLWSLRPNVKPLGEVDANTLWSRLQGDDPKVAYRTYWQLVNHPEVSVPLFEQHIQPTRLALTENQLQALLAKLDSDMFDEREAATKALAKVARSIEPTLRTALEQSTSAEAIRRLQTLLEKADSETKEDVLQRRVCAILENISNPESRALLRKLATGAANAPLTRRALRSLERMPSRNRWR